LAHSLTICMLASGSKGNAIYIAGNTTSILVDAGLSGAAIERRLESKGLHPENLDAILVTHEHFDHVHGAGILARRYGLPVYISPDTMKSASHQLGNIDDLHFFKCGKSFNINELSIHPFPISHDAKDPAGITIQTDQKKIGIATDLGIATSVVRENLKGCTALILEANHDPAMLAEGPYPWHLKQRVKSRVGHLSNEEAKNLLMEIQHSGLTQVILAHLSQQNNTPEKAMQTVGQALNSSQTKLTTAIQGSSGELIKI